MLMYKHMHIWIRIRIYIRILIGVYKVKYGVVTYTNTSRRSRSSQRVFSFPRSSSVFFLRVFALWRAFPQTWVLGVDVE
jgi:hypothetical protein